MASKTRLEFDVLANDKASSKLDKIARGARQLGSGLVSVGRAGATGFGKLGHLIGGAAKMGVAGVAVLGAGLMAAAPKVADMAGNLELMGKKAKVVFGSELGTVERWASANAHAMGLTKRGATGLAAGFADLLIPMGFARKQAAAMATDTVGLAGALSEWTGGTKSAAEVTEILSAAFMGERDGLNALGISITQAEVDAELLAKGQDKLTGKALQQAEALATQKLIMEKSTDAQAAFAKGGDSLARKLTVSKARLREMGETLLVSATPALTKMADAVGKHVLPKLEQFTNWLSGDGKYALAEAFTGMASDMLAFVRITTTQLLKWASMTVKAFAVALGWHPTWGRKLRDAASKIDEFAQDVNSNLHDAQTEVDKWNAAVKNMRTQAKLKADIKDLETKLATARTELKNPALSKEYKAQLRANIADLEAKIRTAKSKLGSTELTRQRVAQLRANITDLDNKIRSAKTKLADPRLTATKRAQLQANISQLLAAKRQAQAAINALRGKTVHVNVHAHLFNPNNIGGIPNLLRPPGRASGGPVRAGAAYIVGERGPELFVPNQNGGIVPNGAGGTVIHLSVGSGSRFVRALMQDLKDQIRIDGGGNVQAVLGS